MYTDNIAACSIYTNYLNLQDQDFTNIFQNLQYAVRLISLNLGKHLHQDRNTIYPFSLIMLLNTNLFHLNPLLTGQFKLQKSQGGEILCKNNSYQMSLCQFNLWNSRAAWRNILNCFRYYIISILFLKLATFYLPHRSIGLK